MFVTVLHPKSLAQMLAILNLDTIAAFQSHFWETLGDPLFLWDRVSHAFKMLVQIGKSLRGLVQEGCVRINDLT